LKIEGIYFYEGNRLPAITDAIMALPKLSSLSLRNIYPQTLYSELMRNLKSASNLTILKTDILPVADDMKNFVSLEVLEFFQHSLAAIRPDPDADGAIPSRIPFLPNLRVIYPADTEIDAKEVILLSDLAILKDITLLKITPDLTLDELRRVVSLLKGQEAPLTEVCFQYSSVQFSPKNFVELVSRELGPQLRQFLYTGSDDRKFPDEFGMTDECIEILVKYCPLLEVLTLQNCWNLTRKSMALMHRRWMATLRYLDISPGSQDGFYNRCEFGRVANDTTDSHQYFFFDECFSD
jgi:hypothetical protein